MHVLLVVEEHSPRRQRREVSTVVGFCSGVERHNDVFYSRWVVVRPQPPPIPLDDCSLFTRRILLILRVPLEHRHGRLSPQQRWQVKKRRPEGFLHKIARLFVLDLEDRRELHHLVLVGVLVVGHIAYQTPCEVILVPSGVNYSYATTRHQTRPGTEGEPLVGFVECREVSVQDVLFGVRIVDKQQVSTAAREGRTHARGVKLAGCGRIPAPSRL